MPSLYPENKSYGSAAPAKPLSIADFQSALKKMKDRTAQQQAAKVSSPTSYSTYASSAPAEIKPTTPNFETNKILIPETERSSPLAQYPTSTPLENPVSSGSMVKTMPQSLGGSQYVSDPAQPGKLVKWFSTSQRATNTQENALIKAGYDPKYYEIDHELPVALGGADTVGNKVILAKPDHDVKSRIQQVAIQLQQAGKISDKEAQGLAMNWQSYKPYLDQIPNLYDEKGNYKGITTEEAQKVYSDFKKAPNLTWKSFKEAIPDAPQQIKNPFAREFFKGAVSQIPLLDFALPGIRKYTANDQYQDPADQSAASFGKVAGVIFGNVAAFGAVGKVLGVAGKGLGIAGRALGLINDAKEAETIINTIRAGKALKSVEEGAGIKTLAEASKFKDLLGKGTDVAKLATSDMMRTKLGEGAINATLGQMYRQDEEGLKNRMVKAAGDFATGMFIGGDPAKLKSYVTTMGGAATISLMMGDDIQDALTNGAAMTALHGLTGAGPLLKGVKAEWGSPHINLAKQVEEAIGHVPSRNLTLKEKFSTKRFTKEGGSELRSTLNQQNIEENINQAQVKVAKEIRGQLHGEGYNPKNAGNNPDLLDKENKILFNKLADKAVAENWTPDQLKTEMKKVLMSGRVLYKEGLSPEARLAADLEDVWTVRKKVLEGKITAQDKPQDINMASDMINKDPQTFVRPEKPKIDEIVMDDHIAIPLGGTGENIKGGVKNGPNGVKENVANMEWLKDHLIKNPSSPLGRILTPDEVSAAGLSKYNDPRYTVIATDSYTFPENDMHTKTMTAIDSAIDRKKAAGIPLTGPESNHVNSKHPDIASGSYIVVEKMGENGQKQYTLGRIGSTARSSNYHAADLRDVNGARVKEWDLENHNKDTVDQRMKDNGLKAIKGKSVIIMDTRSGHPFAYTMFPKNNLDESKAFTQMLNEHIGGKQANIAKSVIKERPVVTAAAPVEAAPVVMDRNTENLMQELDRMATDTPDIPENDKVMAALSGTEPVAKAPVSPVVEKTGSHITAIRKEVIPEAKISTKLSSKEERLANLEHELNIVGESKLEEIKDNKDKDGFIRMAKGIIDNTGEAHTALNKAYKDPSLHITPEENRAVTEKVKQKLRMKAEKLANEKYPVKNILSFAGKDAEDPALIKKELDSTKKKLGLWDEEMGKKKMTKEQQDQYDKENGLEELVGGLKPGEKTVKDMMIRQQLELKNSPFAAVFAKVGKGKMTKGGVNITRGAELKSGIEKIIAKPEDTFRYGWNKAMNEGLAKLFPSKFKTGSYASDFTLNSLLQDQFGKGKLFRENYYKTVNKEGHPFSQPKDVVKAGNLSKEARAEAYAKRKEDLAASGTLGSDYVDSNYHLVDELQGEDSNVKDLVAGEMRNFGLLSGAAGVKQDAKAGANAALGLLDEWANIIKKPNEKRAFIPYDEIKKVVEKSIPKTAAGEYKSNIEKLIPSLGNKIEGATKENPKFIISENTDSRYTKRGAASIPSKNVIILEPKTLQKKFDEKAWTKPAVPGVIPLPEKEFSTLEDYVDFVKNHERAHLLFDEKLNMNPMFRGMSEADRENFINEAVLGRDLAKNPVGGSRADVEAYQAQRLKEETESTKDAIKKRPK